MPISITMPALSPTMEEGTLAKWLVKEGESVSSGDVIAEIETDKATMEVEAIDEGTVGKLLVAEGAEGIKVNTVIAILLEDGEDTSAAVDTVSPPATEQPKALAALEPQATPVVAAPVAAPAADTVADRIAASPLARRMAAQAGVNLAALSGSGPNGRIVKADIELALSGGASAPTTSAVAMLLHNTATTTQPSSTNYTEIPNSQMRKVIARRLTESKQMVPHFYLTIDCNIDNLLTMRKELNQRGAIDGSYKLSVNDFIIRAAALALKKVPDANVSWTDAATLRYHSADISVAVAVKHGLITPIVRNADSKGLAAISVEMKDLAGRAHDGKLAPEEYQGGTFSISNLGMLGIKEFSAVINPPQGAILAVGAGEQRPIVIDGALSVATVMSCTLSCDHRAVDGAIGAKLLNAFKGLIEDPVTMLL